MSEQPRANDKVMSSMSKISSSEEAKKKELAKPNIQKKSHCSRSHNRFRSDFSDFFNKYNEININKESRNDTFNIINFTNINVSNINNDNDENQNKNNNSHNSDNNKNKKENNSDSFGQGDMLSFNKNNGFFPKIPIQSKDLIAAINNNTHLGQQILSKLDEMINKSSEVNQELKNTANEMKSATAEMKKSNSTQKEMLALLIDLVKKLPALKLEEGQNNTTIFDSVITSLSLDI